MQKENNSNWELILCSGAEHLADELHRNGFMTYVIGQNYDRSRIFANGDVYTSLPDITNFCGKKICIIQSLTSSGELDQFVLSTQDRLVELLQVLQILKEPVVVSFSKGEKIYSRIEPPAEVMVLCLHMAFSKQDQLYRTGELNSSKHAIDLMFLCGATRIAAIDPHVPPDFIWIKDLTNKGLFIPISMYQFVVEKFRSGSDTNELYFISTPGKTRTPLGMNLPEISKERVSTNEVLMVGHIDSNLIGKRICLIDDMIISGTTIRKARQFFMNQGTADVFCWITHALPYHPAKEDNLRELIREYNGNVFVSNTIRTKTFEKLYPANQISCVPLITKFLEIH